MNCLLILTLLIGTAPNPKILNKVDSLPSADRPIVYSIIAVESGFDPKVTSKVGAKGLMQLTPQAVKEVRNRNPGCIGVIPVDYYNIEQNISIGYCYYKLMLGDLEHHAPLALAAYNGGPKRAKLLRKLHTVNKETANFVAKVLYTESLLKRSCYETP